MKTVITEKFTNKDKNIIEDLITELGISLYQIVLYKKDRYIIYFTEKTYVLFDYEKFISSNNITFLNEVSTSLDFNKIDFKKPTKLNKCKVFCLSFFNKNTKDKNPYNNKEFLYPEDFILLNKHHYNKIKKLKVNSLKTFIREQDIWLNIEKEIKKRKI